MSISEKINIYIENSKIRGNLAKWKKSVIGIYITPITANIPQKEFYYSEIKRAISEWNNHLKSISAPLFVIKSEPAEADVIIHWVKVGIKNEGMCKYLSVINNEIKKVSIDVGLYNEYSGKNTTNESIFFVMMHELGHSLGLGHGVEIDDLMYVPHQKNISTPSENDLFVLRKIYS